MKAKLFFIAVFCTAQQLYHSQERETKVDTVYIVDKQIDKQNKFHLLHKISDQEALKNSANLSDVLRFQTPIYIKENGKGAVSSPSFRGTTAQQTAFLWNGININSVFLGQGDINNISFLLADDLLVKSGGGSVVYGSAAIGGSIHLNNSLSFNKGFGANFYSEVASYGTFINVLKTSYSDKKLSIQVSGNYTTSENDYNVKEKNYDNLNGKYSNGGIHWALAYKISPAHQISWITDGYTGKQGFPIFETSQNRSQYHTQNFRSLGIWDFSTSQLSNHLRLAYTEDEFKYYQKENFDPTSGGNSQNYIIKNDFDYSLTPKLKLNVLAEFQQNKAQGYQSGIDQISRSVFSGSALFNYQPLDFVEVEAGLKKDAVQHLQSPWLYSFSGKWKPTKDFQTAFSFSKNFRYPSFNDLYYQPGGNLDLLPETSLQYELKVQYQNKNWSLIVTPYFMDISDMIRWLPSSEGYWKAVNTNKVQSLGVETQLGFQKKWRENGLKASLGYTYTKSTNQETKMQLMYVPFHKAQGMVEYQFKNAKIYLQGLWNGKTYTDSQQKESEALLSYFVFNSGVECILFQNFTLGAKVNNLSNQVYATTAYYYLPQRNYALTLKINF